MKRLVTFCLLCISVACIPVAVHAEETAYPDYMLKAQSSIEKASFKASELDSFADEVLIARNFMRNAEAEYKKNLSWSGKLDEKVEPTVRYYAAMARLQAQVVISRAEKVAQEKERVRLEGLVTEAKNKIKVFDDKNIVIAQRDATISDLNAQLAARKGEIEQLTARVTALDADLAARSASGSSAEKKVADLTAEVQTLKQSLAAAENKASGLTAELEKAKGIIAQKGAAESQSQEQIQALNRARQFGDETGKLGGVMKPAADGMTVILARGPLFRISGKTTVMSPEGVNVAARIVGILTTFDEYRAVVKVHGFGTPARSEDAAATDYMARLLRDELVVKGKVDPTAVEAMGAGTSSPLFAKGNPDGNRRVEITFVKKQVK